MLHRTPSDGFELATLCLQTSIVGSFSSFTVAATATSLEVYRWVFAALGAFLFAPALFAMLALIPQPDGKSRPNAVQCSRLAMILLFWIFWGTAVAGGLTYLARAVSF